MDYRIIGTNLVLRKFKIIGITLYESIDLVREFRIISAHCLRGQILEEYLELSNDYSSTRFR